MATRTTLSGLADTGQHGLGRQKTPEMPALCEASPSLKRRDLRAAQDGRAFDRARDALAIVQRLDRHRRERLRVRRRRNRVGRALGLRCLQTAPQLLL